MPLHGQQIEKLNQPLNNERVKHRTGGGGMQLNYLAGYDVIATANELFGFGEWGYDLLAVDLINVMAENSELVGGYYAARLRLTVRDCMPITEEGVCAISGGRNPKALVDAHDMARKGAITDALKRAFRCYGEQFGNSLYDKEYDARVSHSDDTPRQQQGQNRVQAPQGARPSVLPPITQNAPQTATQPAARAVPKPVPAQNEEKATEPQRSAIVRMAGKQGIDEIDLYKRLRELYGTDLNGLTKSDAGHYIQVLQGK